ncbi:hypothetical protein GQ42DRAFT_158429 [Ramicandelaber brevisporus]|nr:hypothetical protein GQ42DRAFT_158429 [Ramicandelaber brevisporus]
MFSQNVHLLMARGLDWLSLAMYESIHGSGAISTHSTTALLTCFMHMPWIMPSPHALRSGARRSTNLTGHTRSSSSSSGSSGSSGTATTPSPSSLSPAHSATSVRSTLSRERSFSDCTPACGGSGVVVGNDSIAAVSLAVNAATKSNSNSSIHRGGRSYRSFTAPSSDDRSRSITNSAATSTSIINLSAVRTRLLHQPPQTATVGSSHGGLFVHPLLQSRPSISAPSSRPSIISNLSTHTYSSTVTSNTASSSSTTATTTTAGGREQQQQQQQRVRFSIQPPQQPLPPPPPQQLDIGYITHLASLPHNPPRVSLNDLDPFAMKSGWIWYLDTLSASATSTATAAAATSSEHDKSSGVGSSASAAARRLLTRSKQWKRRYLILIGIPRDQHHSQPQPQPPSISEAMMDEGTNEVDVFVKSPRSEPKAARHLKVLGEVSCCLYRFKSSPSSQSPPQPADFSQSMVSLVSMDSISSLQQQQPQSPLDVIRRKHRSNSAGEWSEKALRLTADTVAFVSNQYPEREWVIEIRQPKQLNNGSSFSGGYQSGSATASSSSSIHSVPSDTSMSNSVNGGSGSGGGSGRSDVSGAPYNTFFLQAEDKDDMMQWLNSLRSIIARLYYAARPLPPVPRHVVGSANSTASTATPVSTISSIMPSPHVLVPIPLMDEVLLVEHNFPVVDDGDSMDVMDDNNANDGNDDSDSELPEIFSPTMCAILGTGEQTQQRPTDKAARLLGIPSAGNMPLPIQPRAVTIATPVPSKIRTDAGQAASGGYSWMSAALQPPSISTASLNTTTTTASDSFGCVTSPDSLKVGSIRELHSFNATTTTTTTTSSNASDSFCMQNDASHFRQYDAAALAAATAATVWLPQSDLLVKPLPPMPHPPSFQSHQLQQIPRIHQRQSSLRSTPVAVAVGSGSINAIQKRLGVENKDLHVALSESRRPSAIAAGHVASTMSRASRMTSAELRRSISLYDLHSPQQPAFTTVATTSHASATAPQSRPSEPRGFMNLDDDDDEIEESYDSFAQTPVNAPFNARNGSFSSSNLSNIFSGQQKKLGKRGSKIHSILLGSGSVDISGNSNNSNSNNSSGGSGGSGGGSKGSALSKIVRLVRPKKMPSLTSFPTPTKQSLQLQQPQQHYQRNAHQLSKQSYYHHHTPDYWIPTISADFAASSATLNHINN